MCVVCYRILSIAYPSTVVRFVFTNAWQTIHHDEACRVLSIWLLIFQGLPSLKPFPNWPAGRGRVTNAELLHLVLVTACEEGFWNWSHNTKEEIKKTWLIDIDMVVAHHAASKLLIFFHFRCPLVGEQYSKVCPGSIMQLDASCVGAHPERPSHVVFYNLYTSPHLQLKLMMLQK